MANNQEKKIVAIVPSAGVGKRFGRRKNKPFHLLSGKPLIIWSLEALQGVKEIKEIIPVVKEEDMKTVASLIEKYNISKVKRIVPGGKERQDSVYNGIKVLNDDVSVVLIHDGVRPLVEKDLIKRTISELRGFDGVIAGVPVKDTIKEVSSKEMNIVVLQTLNRNVLWAIQTPQVFRYKKLREAFEKAKHDNYYGTDDAALVERYGGRVKIVMGSYRNIKITTSEDIQVAEALIRI
ncbi:MAG: 2-C-methyl-D-erythritol 4-phosphate cytidylyltransferase [Thermodesulfovibrio sp.]|nr:2-C-methyl-D-erythritol 4-phosphate cytidylyltransferase [Thermodesulfovibrio sp.]